MKARPSLMLALVAAMFAVQSAGAGETTPLARDGGSFLFEFCGKVLGTGSAEMEKARKDLSTATLFPAEPVFAGSPKLRDAVVSVLKIQKDAPAHRVTFKASTPKSLAIGFIRPDLAMCMVIFVGPSGAMTHTLERVATADSGWQEIYGTEDSRTWQRTRHDGRVLTLQALGNEKSTTITLDVSLPILPTIAEFDAFADSLRDGCVRSVAGGLKPDTKPFETAFKVLERHPDESVLLESKDALPGGRLLLIPADRGSGCLFATDKADAKIPYQRAFSASFMRLPGAQHQKPPDEVWFYAESTAKYGVAMFTEIRDGALLITFERDSPPDTPKPR